MKPKSTIIFMGTPDFSVPALQRLAEHPDFRVSLVVTQPDRPKGRGKKLAPSPVKTAAMELNIDVFQPEKINDKASLKTLSDLQPDFFVVSAFGQILSRQILDIPKLFPINIHASLLPKYRGASPIQAAILNMDKVTGVTTMVMAKDMDAGDILMSRSTPVSPEDTAQDLHDRLGQMGADLVIETLHAVLENHLDPLPQDHSRATYVKLLKKKDGLIDWHLSNRQIQAHINAMTPWPGAFTYLGDRRLKIYRARASEIISDNDPGVIFQCDEAGIHVATGSGSLTITELMGTSGKRLSAADFLRGNKIEPPAKFDPS